MFVLKLNPSVKEELRQQCESSQLVFQPSSNDYTKDNCLFYSQKTMIKKQKMMIKEVKQLVDSYQKIDSIYYCKFYDMIRLKCQHLKSRNFDNITVQL